MSTLGNLTQTHYSIRTLLRFRHLVRFLGGSFDERIVSGNELALLLEVLVRILLIGHNQFVCRLRHAPKKAAQTLLLVFTANTQLSRSNIPLRLETSLLYLDKSYILIVFEKDFEVDVIAQTRMQCASL